MMNCWGHLLQTDPTAQSDPDFENNNNNSGRIAKAMTNMTVDRNGTGTRTRLNRLLGAIRF